MTNIWKEQQEKKVQSQKIKVVLSRSDNQSSNNGFAMSTVPMVNSNVRSQPDDIRSSGNYSSASNLFKSSYEPEPSSNLV